MKTLARVLFGISLLGNMLVPALTTKANATLLALDDSRFGIDSFTLDTTTGLQWLDLTKTVNLSINDIRAHMGANDDYNGLRYATSAEVSQLYSDAGLNVVTVTPPSMFTTYNGYSNSASNATASYFAAYDLLKLIGYLPPPYSTTQASGGEVPHLLIWGVTGDGPIDAFDHYMISELEAGGADGAMRARATISYQDDDVRATSSSYNKVTGSFLVKEESSAPAVPEPSTILLLGAGLACVAFVKRRFAVATSRD